MKTERELFLYELDGHGYSFSNDQWDEESGRFFDDQLNMAWEMWQAATQREGFTPDIYSGNAVSLKSYEYKSPLNGGTSLVATGNSCYNLKTENIPVGGELYLPHDLIHTVSCSKGTIWVVQELGFEDDSSTVLGVDFTTDGLYTEPKQFRVNDMFQTVLGKLKELV